MENKESYISVVDLTMAYGDFVVMRNLNFSINRGDIFIIMGGSGCGKSTLLRHMIGLKPPAKGDILYGDFNFWKADQAKRQQMMRNVGILYQSGALWSSMTLAENVALPLQQYTKLSKEKIRDQVSLKLALVAPLRIRGFLSFGNQRRHAQAGRPGAGHGPGPGDPFFR